MAVPLRKKIRYDLRKGALLFLPPVMSAIHGRNYAHFRGTLTWNQLPSSIKSIKRIIDFKTNLNQLRNIECGFAVCRKLFLFIFLFIHAFIYLFSLMNVFKFASWFLLAFPRIVPT